jgi:hypothetical protein
MKMKYGEKIEKSSKKELFKYAIPQRDEFHKKELLF